jgi:serine phosphatase RsbU (regulator of sigma subunit)
VIAIGDVLGHDTEAAAAMGQVRSMLRGIALTGAAESTGPADVLRGLDRAMTSLDLSTTATAVVARLSPRAAHAAGTVLTWANAGHPPPLVVGAAGAVTQLTGPRNDLLLGVLPDAPRTEHLRVLEQGATVLLYTDGLVERRGQSIDDGLARLGDLLCAPGTHRLALEDLCDRVMSELVDPTPQDDVALVAVRLAPRGT